MKIFRSNFKNRKHRAQCRGSAVIVFLALLGIMLLLIAASDKAIFHFQRELKLTEQRQIQRLNSQTNAPAKTSEK